MTTSAANKARKAPAKAAAVRLNARPVEMIELSDLDFDVNNPRFGAEVGQRQSQREILNHLVRTFGVDDVLSSIAVNGYFVAEPMIVRRAKGKLVVVEGNRRLASCLILAGDERAKDQKNLTDKYRAVAELAQREVLDRVACIVFDEQESSRELLAYLGVRHIASSQGWDSYAKAAWIARAVKEHGITLEEIAAMTGDQNKTVSHLLEGHYFIEQMVSTGYFDPKQSQRKGRGSNVDFPFSWVYTLLFTPAARKFIGLPDEPVENPVPEDKLQRAGMLLERMFGTAHANAAIDDSRDITRLARSLDSPEKVALLETGKHISQIEFEVQPLEDKLRKGLHECQQMLGTLTAAIESSKIERSQANGALGASLSVARLAMSIYKALEKASKDDLLDELPE